MCCSRLAIHDTAHFITSLLGPSAQPKGYDLSLGLGGIGVCNASVCVVGVIVSVQVRVYC